MNPAKQNPIIEVEMEEENNTPSQIEDDEETESYDTGSNVVSDTDELTYSVEQTKIEAEISAEESEEENSSEDKPVIAKTPKEKFKELVLALSTQLENIFAQEINNIDIQLVEKMRNEFQAAFTFKEALEFYLKADEITYAQLEHLLNYSYNIGTNIFLKEAQKPLSELYYFINANPAVLPHNALLTEIVKAENMQEEFSNMDIPDIEIRQASLVDYHEHNAKEDKKIEGELIKILKPLSTSSIDEQLAKLGMNSKNPSTLFTYPKKEDKTNSEKKPPLKSPFMAKK